ncbi:MAG TPA: hypothetical protein VNZ49_07320 [Bacteroidia bacterium]|jgi:hypothetical protein|nr:hypothetical protein [Bacteroidia bacterium]
MVAPLNISLVQMHEGYVAIEPPYGDTSLNPAVSGATHIRVYLSTAVGVLGNLYATVKLDSAGGLFFNAPPGWFGWVTLRNYNINTGAETTNTNQIVLQVFERVLKGFNIIHFFHDKRVSPSSQYAIGFRQSDNAVFVLHSTNYFTTYNIVSSWSPGTIKNEGMLTFYIDEYGYMYVANNPGVLISTDGGNTWTQLILFQSSQSSLQPFWNITEDESLHRILISEYGSAPNGPHHMLWWCDGANRSSIGSWTSQNLNWGNYRHIHGYHVNLYKPNIHFLFLGDPTGGQPSDGTPGFYLSQDHGTTWSDEVLNQIAANWQGNNYNFNADHKFRNGPCQVTWWPSGKALITNDSAGRAVAAWYGNGPIMWGALNLNPKINLLGDIDPFSTWPATPWDGKAVENGYETYCATNHDNPAYLGDPNFQCNSYTPSTPPGGAIAYTPPSLLFRYDAISDQIHPNNDGNTGIMTMIAKLYWPAVPFLYISAGRGNVFPSDADYIFCNAWGGIRIPRKVRRHIGPIGPPTNLPD